MMQNIYYSYLNPLAIMLLLIAVTSIASAAEIKVRTDRNPVNLSESFQLVFSADASPDGNPDFRVLEFDFEILKQNQSSNVSIVNGSFSKTVQWTLTVMAKRVGEIVIPAVPFGSDSSKAVRLLVNKGRHSGSSSGQDDDIFIEVKVSPDQPVVQSQVIYTLRVYRQVNIASAQLTEPKMADAIIEKLGEDSNFSTQYNGRSYVVTERKYAIFPQKSGLLTIDPVVMTAEIATGNRRSMGGFFNRPSTRTRRVVSNPIILDVQPIPGQAYGTHWLPAEHLYLEQKWSGDINNLKAGEPVTRTLTLIAKGTTVGQLPALNNITQTIRSTSGGELKSYPDQPLLQEQPKNDSMIAFREEKTAFIPSSAGEYQIPALVISWWNTQTQEMAIARIPATRLITVGGVSSQTQFPTQTIPEIETDTTELSDRVVTNNNLWFWLTIVFGVGWLITLIFWYLSKPKAIPDQSEPQAANDFNIKALRKACHEHNANAAKDALVQWGRQQWQVSSLGKIAGYCDEDLQTEILQLNQALYSQDESTWQGDKLLLAFKKYRQQKVNKDEGKVSVLQPLFKT